MSQPLVSIIIPCYNAEKWLPETLESAISQTWDNTEIFVIDDGSTDKSLEIAKNFESAKVKVISQENNGASAARNRAIQESQGDFIQYLDADDLLSLNKIESQINLLQENPDSVASGSWGRFYSTNFEETRFVVEPVWNDYLPVEWLICCFNGGGMMPIHAWLVPRSISEQAGLWNENLSLNDDGEYFSRVLLASRKIKFCETAKSYYRSGSSSTLSSRRSWKALESFFLSTELCTTHLLQAEDSEYTRYACATAWQRLIYSIYPEAQDLVEQAEHKVKSLGGTRLSYVGGPRSQYLANLVGWKCVKKIQFFIKNNI